MKKFYEAPSFEVTAVESAEDILAGSTDVVINVSSLFDSAVDAANDL